MEFIELLSFGNPEVALAVSERKCEIMDMVESKISNPEGICLLGNLANKNEEIIL